MVFSSTQTNQTKMSGQLEQKRSSRTRREVICHVFYTLKMADVTSVLQISYFQHATKCRINLYDTKSHNIHFNLLNLLILLQIRFSISGHLTNILPQSLQHPPALFIFPSLKPCLSPLSLKWSHTLDQGYSIRLDRGPHVQSGCVGWAAQRARRARTRKIWAFSKCVLYSNTNLRIDANLFDSGCGTMNWII